MEKLTELERLSKKFYTRQEAEVIIRTVHSLCVQSSRRITSRLPAEIAT